MTLQTLIITVKVFSLLKSPKPKFSFRISRTYFRQSWCVPLPTCIVHLRWKNRHDLSFRHKSQNNLKLVLVIIEKTSRINSKKKNGIKID